MPESSLTPGQILQVYADRSAGVPRRVTPSAAIFLGPEKDHLPVSADNPEKVFAAWPVAPGKAASSRPMWSLVSVEKLDFYETAGFAEAVSLHGLSGFSVPPELLEGREGSPTVVRGHDGGWRFFASKEEAEAVFRFESHPRFVPISVA